MPSNDHYYKYVEFPAGTTKTWKQSKIDAESTNNEYYGRKGYLATLTSLEEATLAGDQAPGQGWIGASDERAEGTWEWVTGPEGVTPFWQGNYNPNTGICTGCGPINGGYHNWRRGSSNGNKEPNNWGSGEDFAHVYGDGTWNDFANSSSNVRGYIIEYGGRPGENNLTITDFTQIEIPQIISVIENEICGSGQVTLSAEAY